LEKLKKKREKVKTFFPIMIRHDGTLDNVHVDRETFEKHVSSGIPPSLAKMLVRAYDSIRKQEVPCELDLGPHLTLLPHQRIVVARAIRQQKLLLSLEMGTGKTVCALATCVATRAAHVLIICPASLRQNWASECSRFVPDYTVEQFCIGSIPPTIVDKCIVIISYTLLPKVLTTLTQHHWDMLICDEAHYLKHMKSQRTMVVHQLATRIERLLLLSGTPAQTNEQYWSLLKLLEPESFVLFHTYTRHPPSKQKFYFADRYCMVEQIHVAHGRTAFIFKTNAREEELRFLLSNWNIRMKAIDVLQLPPLTRERVVVGTASETKQKWFAKKLTLVESIRESKGKLYADAAFMELVRETMRIKQFHVCDYLKTMLYENTEQCIIFTYHRDMSEAIVTTLVGMNLTYIQIDGTVPMHVRKDRLAQMESGEAQVAVLSLGACSTGLNLMFCNWCIYAEMSFHSEKHVQADYRCWRYGQTRPVTIQSLIMLGTTDVIVERVLQSKIKFNT
jgi:SWI/SNF-related matrix-associated actin-dependent regulator 1 of chromatin subfamily A